MRVAEKLDWKGLNYKGATCFGLLASHHQGQTIDVYLNKHIYTIQLLIKMI
jgi:hypothetical protein